MRIKCVVAGSNANGTPDLFFCIVECTEDMYDNGNHYDAAIEYAGEQGYDGPMVAFDENDGPSGLFALFVWDSATIIKA